MLPIYSISHLEKDIINCKLNLWVIEIESDAKLVVVVDLLKKDGDISNGNDNIVTDFKEGLKKIPMVIIL